MESDDWSWAQEDRAAPIADLDTASVLAVLVCRNGEPWLPRMLVSLARLEQRPGCVVAVDVASTDQTGDLLRKATSEGLVDRVVTLDHPAGFGAAVVAALDDADVTPEWLWLLHDDTIIRHHALSELVRAGSQPEPDGTRVGVVVPKLLLPKLRNYPDRIAELGATVTRSGRRIASPGQDVEVADLDQRQLDRTRVLGGSTAGMLIRWETWQELGGLDPALELFYDGIDFGWRANDAGWAVVTAPSAALEHRQAGRWDDRAGADDPAALDRKFATRLVASHATRPRRASARLRAGSFFGALGYLLGKDVDRSRGHWRAFRTGGEDASHAVQMHERQPESTDVGGLVPSRGQSFRLGVERTADALTDRVRDAESDDVSIDDLTGDDFAGKGHSRRWYSPTTLVALGLVVLTLVAARHLGGFAPLVGPDLPPAPRSLGDAWSAWWRPNAGVPGTSAPWLLFMAIGSTLALGQPELFVTLLIVGGPVLAMMSALRFARHLASDPWLTYGAAAVWGVMLPLFAVTGRGSIGLTVIAILLPAWAMSAYRCLTEQPEGPDRWRSPGMLSLVTAVIAAFWPTLWLPTVLVAVVAVRRGRDRWPAVVVILAPLAVVGGWLPFLARNPGRLLTASDPAYAPSSSWQGPVGLPDVVPAALVVAVLAVLLAAAVTAVVAGRPSLWLSIGAFVAGAVAAAVPRLLVTVDGVSVRPDATIWLLIGVGCLLWLVVTGDLVGKVRVAVASLVVVAAVAGLTWWAVGGLAPLHRSRGPLPEYVQSAVESTRSTRVLLVDLSGDQGRFAVEANGVPRWGRGEHNPLRWQPLGEAAGDAARQITEQAISDELADRLANVGVGYVWIAGGSPELAASLESAGLVSAPINDRETVWAVPGLPGAASVRPSRDSIDSSEPVVESTIQVGENATLVLAEQADPRWRATFNHTTLQPVDDLDRQVFELPSGEGEVSWRLAAPWWWSVLQVVALVTCVVLAAPSLKASSPTARRAL